MELKKLRTVTVFVIWHSPPFARILSRRGWLKDRHIWKTGQEDAETCCGHCFQPWGKTVDFVTDRYPSTSIKGGERERRAALGVQQIFITRAEQKTPRQFSKYLSSGKNKESLVEFLEWSRSSANSFKGVTVVIAHCENCHSLISVSNHSSEDQRTNKWLWRGWHAHVTPR